MLKGAAKSLSPKASHIAGGRFDPLLAPTQTEIGHRATRRTIITQCLSLPTLKASPEKYHG